MEWLADFLEIEYTYTYIYCIIVYCITWGSNIGKHSIKSYRNRHQLHINRFINANMCDSPSTFDHSAPYHSPPIFQPSLPLNHPANLLSGRPSCFNQDQPLNQCQTTSNTQIQQLNITESHFDHFKHLNPFEPSQSMRFHQAFYKTFPNLSCRCQVI
jgi:hypothetical protein